MCDVFQWGGCQPPPPSKSLLLLGGSDPPPSKSVLLLGGVDPPPRKSDVLIWGPPPWKRSAGAPARALPDLRRSGIAAACAAFALRLFLFRDCCVVLCSFISALPERSGGRAFLIVSSVFPPFVILATSFFFLVIFDYWTLIFDPEGMFRLANTQTRYGGCVQRSCLMVI